MHRRLPPLTVVLGVGGLIPFVVAGLGAVSASDMKSMVAVHALIGYGAVILGFLGGVHWGFALDEEGPAERTRLVLGTVPSIVGWFAIVVGLAATPVLALGLLIAGFIMTAVVEGRGAARGLVPSGYMVERWVLTVVVAAILTTVLLLRLIGAHLIY